MHLKMKEHTVNCTGFLQRTNTDPPKRFLTLFFLLVTKGRKNEVGPCIYLFIAYCLGSVLLRYLFSNIKEG
jgi:hypothetical protein